MAIKKKAKASKGRPTTYSIKLADEICEYIAEGNSLNAWLKDKPNGKPKRTTVYRWLDKHQEFRNNYVRAKEDSADFHAEEILEVARDANLHPNDKRVQIDAMKWVASKLKPKSYGDRVAHEVTDGEGLPLVPVINVTIGA